jgi:bis(5'-nucleosyl)-tetraphosphatase (symmetrical)
MMHAASGYAMVHAGLLPQWNVAQALGLAGEVEAALGGPDYVELVKNMYGNSPTAWDERLHGFERLRVIVNAMTRLRLCDAAGNMEFSHHSAPVDVPKGYMPWFDVPGRASAGTPIVCGHWAALGLLLRDDLVSIDTGCVWGRALSAVRLDDRRLSQCDCSALRGVVPEG